VGLTLSGEVGLRRGGDWGWVEGRSEGCNVKRVCVCCGGVCVVVVDWVVGMYACGLGVRVVVVGWVILR